MHGCASQPNSIRITLEQENRESNPLLSVFDAETGWLHADREDHLREIPLQLATRHNLLFLGYSGRDAVLPRLVRSKKPIRPMYWLFYEKAPASEISFILQQVKDLNTDFFYTFGDVSELLDLPCVEKNEFKSLSSVSTTTVNSEPKMACSEAVALASYLGLLGRVLPLTCINVVRHNQVLLLELASKNRNIAAISADTFRQAGDIRRAISCYEMASSLGANSIFTQSRLALTYADAGDFKRAEQIFTAINNETQLTTSSAAAAWYKYHLGEFHRMSGQLSIAEQLFSECIELTTMLGDKWLLSCALNSKGFVHQKYNQPAKALEYLERSLEIKKEIGARTEIGNTMNNIGSVLMAIGQLHEAAQWLEESSRWKSQIGDEFGLGSAYTNLGNIYLMLGDLDRAEEFALRGLEQNVK